MKFIVDIPDDTVEEFEGAIFVSEDIRFTIEDLFCLEDGDVVVTEAK